MKKKPIIWIVMPAYNAAETLEATYREIPKYLRNNIILVDDASSDNTVIHAKRLTITTYVHLRNKGYGSNQKTCYREVLRRGTDVVVMIHPDYQYDARYLPALIKPILKGEKDYMFGSRISSRVEALSGGMPPLKYILNRITCVAENILLGVNFSEHFSGFRAYSADVLKTISFEKFSDDFVFDQQCTLAILHHGFRVGEIPIPTRYHAGSSSIGYMKGIKFLLETFWNIVLMKLHSYNIIHVGYLAQRSSRE